MYSRSMKGLGAWLLKVCTDPGMENALIYSDDVDFIAKLKSITENDATNTT